MTDDKTEIDRLLSEAKDAEPVLKEISTKLDAVVEKQNTLAEQQEADRKAKAAEGVNEAIAALKAKVPENMRGLDIFADAVLEGYLNDKAAKDETLMKAFTERFQSPSDWEQAKSALADTFGKQFDDLPDANLTADREAALASSKTTESTETEFDEKAVGKMSAKDFDDLQKQLGVEPFGYG